eukprot:403356704
MVNHNKSKSQMQFKLSNNINTAGFNVQLQKQQIDENNYNFLPCDQLKSNAYLQLKQVNSQKNNESRSSTQATQQPQYSSDMSFDQLRKEARNLYSTLFDKDKIIIQSKPRGISISQNQEAKKAFKIKHKVLESGRTENNYLENRYYERDRDQSNQNKLMNHEDSLQNESFLDKIRRTFSEQKYMKREDVLKLLRDLQQNSQAKIKQKVFDQQEIFKSFALGQDSRLFNSTQPQQFIQSYKRDKSVNIKKSIHGNQSEDLSHLFSVSRMSKYDQKMGSMLNKQKYPFTDENMQDGASRNINSVIKESSTNKSSFTPAKSFKGNLRNFNNQESEINHQTNDYKDKFAQGSIQEPQRQIKNEKEETFSDMMKVGFRSLRKYENKNKLHKGATTTKRSKSQMSQMPNLITGQPIMTNMVTTAYQTQDKQGFKDMIRGDQYKQDENMNKIQQELYEVYMNQKMSTVTGLNFEQLRQGTVSYDKRRINILNTQTKPYTAIQNPRPIKKLNNTILFKINPKEPINDLKYQNQILNGCVQNNHCNMPPAKIKIIAKPESHLQNSLTNKIISNINQFVVAVFKQKVKLSDQQLTSLFKFIGIQIPKVNGLMDFTQFKSKEFLNQANEKLLQKLYKTLNSENNNVEPIIGKTNLPFYVGKGNNYQLVRQLIKRRVWWTRATKEEFNSYLDSEDQTQKGCHFIWTQWKKQKHIDYLKKNKGDQLRLYNRLDDNFHLSNKKALFQNIANYYKSKGLDPFEIAIPLSFHIRSLDQQKDEEYKRFLFEFQKLKQQGQQNVWIIKPGENTNRGCGIQVSNSLSEIQSLLSELKIKSQRTFIVQKYIEKPLLISGRKFDIRCYGLLTSINGVQKGYFYRDCYFRTSSKEYDIDDLSNRLIHLTNDAIQKYSDDYGKYENGNKLSINDFQRYLDINFPTLNINFMRDIFTQIECLITDTYKAVYNKIDLDRTKNCFELFGYDFMIDENFRVYLIEANTNPCLEISCPLLARIIPEVVDNTFRITLDPLFQPGQFDPENQTTFQQQQNFNNKDSTQKEKTNKKRTRRIELLPQIKYTLVFDERVDGPLLSQNILKTQGTEDQNKEEEKFILEIAQFEEQAIQEEQSQDNQDEEDPESDDLGDFHLDDI